MRHFLSQQLLGQVATQFWVGTICPRRMVGRPGLDPGTLGLKAASLMSPGVPSRRGESSFRRRTAVRSKLVETYSIALRRRRTELLGQMLGGIRRTVIRNPKIAIARGREDDARNASPYNTSSCRRADNRWVPWLRAYSFLYPQIDGHPGRPPGDRPTTLWGLRVNLRRSPQGSATPASGRP